MAKTMGNWLPQSSFADIDGIAISCTKAAIGIRGTELNKGSVLDELKKVPPAEQMDRVLIVSHSRQ